MRHPLSVYSSVRLEARTRRALVAILAAVAVLLGLAAPALASGGHATSAATTHTAHPGGLATGSFRPLVNRVSGGSITGHVTFPASHYADYFTQHNDRTVTIQGNGISRVVYVYQHGDFNTHGLPVGTYTVSFNRLSDYSTAAAQFYDGQDEFLGPQSATPVSVTSAHTTPGINATLHEGGHLTGRLVDGTGAALSCQVEAFTTDGSRIARYGFSTDVNGSFDIGGLTTGSYYLRVVPLGGFDCQVARFLSTGSVMTTTGPGASRSVTQGVATSLGAIVYGTPVVPPVIPVPPVVIPPTPAPAFAVTHKAKVAGPAVVGAKVKVKLATLSPAPSKVTFQWLRNGHQIKQAKHKSYKITQADAGKKLSVKVVYERPGYPDLKVVTKVGRVHPPKHDRLLQLAVTGLF